MRFLNNSIKPYPGAQNSSSHWGCIFFKKCSWVPINYSQSNGTCLYKSSEGTGKMKVVDDDRVSQNISRLEVNKAEDIMWGMVSSQ